MNDALIKVAKNGYYTSRLGTRQRVKLYRKEDNKVEAAYVCHYILTSAESKELKRASISFSSTPSLPSFLISPSDR